MPPTVTTAPGAPSTGSFQDRIPAPRSTLPIAKANELAKPSKKLERMTKPASAEREGMDALPNELLACTARRFENVPGTQATVINPNIVTTMPHSAGGNSDSERNGHASTAANPGLLTWNMLDLLEPKFADNQHRARLTVF